MFCGLVDLAYCSRYLIGASDCLPVCFSFCLSLCLPICLNVEISAIIKAKDTKFVPKVPLYLMLIKFIPRSTNALSSQQIDIL